MPFLRRPQKIDWMGEYNKALEEKGELCLIGCVRYNKKTKQMIDVNYPHTQYDGIGGFIHGLRTAGYNIPEFPKNDGRKKPLFLLLMPQVFRFLFKEFSPRRSIDWRTKNLGAPPQTFGKMFHVFTESETEAIITKAKGVKINYTSLLLVKLHEAVGEILLNKPGLTRWHIPVNMRGFYDGPQETSNHISNFVTEIEAGASPENVYKSQVKELYSGSFFATFFFLNIGDFWGMKDTLKNKVKGDYKKPKISTRMTGTFSSMGKWPLNGEKTRHPDEVMVPFGNVSLMNPFCAVNMIWDRQLILCAQVHSSICTTPEEAKRVVDLWAQKIKGAL